MPRSSRSTPAWVKTARSMIKQQHGQGWSICEQSGRVKKLLVASQAVIGGPATAIAVAAALGRRELIPPALALGMLGYLIGSYLGLGVEKAVGLLS